MNVKNHNGGTAERVGESAPTMTGKDSLATQGCGRHAAYLVPAILLALAAAFFYPVFFTGRTFYAFDNLYNCFPWFSVAPAGFDSHNPLITDPVNQHYLSYLFLKRCLSAGSLPLWYDSNFCGLPFVLGFTPQTNPVVFLSHLLFPLDMAHDLILFLYMLGTGLFMYLYLRQLGLSLLPCAVGAVSWMFNGTTMVWFEFETWTILSCTLPATLLFAERWFRVRRTLDVLFFTCAVCAAISSGMVHLILYQLLFTGAYLIYRYFSLRRSPVQIPPVGKRELPIVLLAILVGVAVSGPLLTSYLAFQGDPQRPAFHFQDLIRNTGQLHPAYLLTLLFPDLFGNPAVTHVSFIPRFYISQVYNNYNELCLYAGILPLFLALANRSGRTHRSLGGFFIVIAIFSLSMAMGSFLYYPLARFVPGLGFSTPTRILYLFGFALSFLAALGAHHLLEGIPREKRGKILGAWFLLFLIVFGIFHFSQDERAARWMLSLTQWDDWENFLPQVRANLVPWSNTLLDPVIISGLTFLLVVLCVFLGRRFRAVFLSLAVVLLVFDLISFGKQYNTVSSKELEFPPTGGIRFLQQDHSMFRVITYDRFMHNTFLPFGIDDIGGYVSLYPKRYGEFLHLSQYGPDSPVPDYFSRWTFFNTVGSPLLDLLNTKYMLVPPGWTMNDPQLKLVYKGEMNIYRNEKAFPRAFLVPGYYLASGRKEAFQALGRFTSEDFKTRVILEQSPGPPFSDSTVSDGDSSGSVHILSHKPDRVEIRVTNPRRGFLVLTDSYDPGWRVTVDGRKAEVMKANYIMRAVALEAGNHAVVFSFRPPLQIAGVAASIAGWLALCICVVLFRMKKRPD